MSETAVSHRARFARPPTARARVRRPLAFVPALGLALGLALSLAGAGAAGPAAAGSPTPGPRATPVAATGAATGAASDALFAGRSLNDAELQDQRGSGLDPKPGLGGDPSADVSIILWDEFRRDGKGSGPVGGTGAGSAGVSISSTR